MLNFRVEKLDSKSPTPAKDRGDTVKESKAPAISRAAAILRLLGKSEEPLSLQSIASHLGINPSSSLYVLRALVAEELVAFDSATKRYALEAGVLTLARQWLRRDQFTDIAQLLLDDLSARFDLTTLGVKYTGLDHIIAVAVSRSIGNMRLSTQVGSRFPALISATGRCLAAFGGYKIEDLQERFEKLRWDNTPDFSLWRDQVEATRLQGYAVDDGNYISGVTVIAAPIHGSGKRPSHALVATGLSSAVEKSGRDSIGNALMNAADVIAMKMGRG